jgi:fructokinase
MSLTSTQADDAPPLPTFVAAGEALTDLVIEDPVHNRWRALVGGASWNVARAMAALGLRSAFAGAISTDVFGDALWNASLAAGLDTRFLQRQPKSPLLAVVHQTAPPRYFFVGDDSADLHFDAARLPTGWRRQARWVHFGGISLARPPLADRLLDVASALKADGVRISYDPNFRALMDSRYDPVLRRMLSLADLVKVSDEDLVGLFRTADADTAFTTLRGLAPQAMVLYTRGADGASLHLGAEQWQAPAPSVKVVDTVGAGDSSAAGMLYSLMQRAQQPYQEHLRFAVAAGAAACTMAGASPPTRAAVEALL